jgi:DNA-directed RNA polymerase subunit beta'
VTTFGEHMVDAILPVEYRGRGTLTKTRLNEILVDIAKKHPDRYPDIVTKLKRLGDEVATLEGISVGLDDIAPHYETRDALVSPFHTQFTKAQPHEREKILLEAQNAVLGHTKNNTGTMGEMVRSGGRGNAAQLMRIIGAPILARDERDRIVPWFIPRSYAEGLKPSDAWVAGNEARINAIKSNISVVEPGDLAKILINNMGDKLITMPDCKTTNGVAMSARDSHAVDRYLAKPVNGVAAGTLLTPQTLQHLGEATLIVRSPMTCEAPHGICQRCQGLASTGHSHPIGTNVGMRAAQALSEPLTQFSLNAKHGGRITTSGDDVKRPEGIKGVRQVLEVPQSFLHKATLAEHAGTVTKVEHAPQGGNYVWVDQSRHYVPPDLHVRASVGKRVEAGDTLSDGVPKPDEVVRHKGLGEGRRYLVDTLHDVYKRAGADIDRRHIETLARSVLNHVSIEDPGDDDSHGFIKGDIVNYNRFAAALAAHQRQLPIDDAIGETLAANTLHFTAGTHLTATVRDTLAKHGIKTIAVAQSGPRAVPIMRAASRTPLLNSDWMARLGHRYLKQSLLEGAWRGDVSDTHGSSPVPAYAAGTEFGEGSEGHY